MTVTSAEVHTLTAEVRVLMVGNRQVTLSIARQLDAVPNQDISPFGRINAFWNRDADVSVIGPHKRTGALVVSHNEHFFKDDKFENTMDAYEYMQTENAAFHDAAGWDHEGIMRAYPWAFKCSNDVATAIRRGRRRYPGGWFREWFDLPLIVLAGLR